MSPLRQLPLVIALLLLAAFATAWALVQRERMDLVDGIRKATAGAVSEAQFSATSPTGYADGARRLVVPGRHAETLQIAQQLSASHSFRQRLVAFDNPPDGRPTHLTAPTREALRLFSFQGDEPAGIALERAVIRFAPWLHTLAGVGLLVGAALSFGWRGAAAATISWLCLFPLNASFQPGVVEARQLVACFAALSSVALFAAIQSGNRLAWIGAGVLLGLALWTRADLALPVAIAFVVAVIVALWRRPELCSFRLLTRTCAAVTAAAWAIEFLPGAFDWHLETVHGVHALLILGLGEAAAALADPREKKARLSFAVGGIALGAWIAVFFLGPTEGFLSRDPLLGRFPGTPDAQASGIFDVISLGGTIGLSTLAACLLFCVLVLRYAFARYSRSTAQLAALVACGLLLLWATWQAFYLPITLATLCAALAVAFANNQTPSPSTAPQRALLLWGPAGILIVASVLGLLASRPAHGDDGKPLAGATDATSMVLRDVAHWLRARNSGEDPVLLAPPESIGALGFLSNWKTVGSFHWENPQGTQGALRIASASSPDEALELFNKRGVSYVILPSWDVSLDALLASVNRRTAIPPQSFLAALRRWEQPRWLRPLAYPAPRVPGAEGLDVILFQVVDEQDEVTAASRLAEFLADTKRLELAATLAVHLERYQTELGALIARAYVSIEANAPAPFREAVAPMPALIDAGAVDTLAFDRRVSLAIVLAQAQEYTRARALLTALMQEASIERIRELTPNQLLRLVVLSRRASVPFPDKSLEEAALQLLPPNVRAMR